MEYGDEVIFRLLIQDQYLPYGWCRGWPGRRLESLKPEPLLLASAKGDPNKSVQITVHRLSKFSLPVALERPRVAGSHLVL